MSQVWSRGVSVLIQGGLGALQKLSSETHNSKTKVILKSFELDTNASQACKLIIIIINSKPLLSSTASENFRSAFFLSNRTTLFHVQLLTFMIYNFNSSTFLHLVKFLISTQMSCICSSTKKYFRLCLSYKIS